MVETHERAGRSMPTARVIALLALATLVANLGIVAGESRSAASTVTVAGDVQPLAGAESVDGLARARRAVSAVGSRIASARDARQASVAEAAQRVRETTEEEQRAARRAHRAAAAAEATHTEASHAEAVPDHGPAETRGRASRDSGASEGSTAGATAPADASPPSEVEAPRSGPDACDLACRTEQIVSALSVPLPTGWRIEVTPAHADYVGLADGGRRVITLAPREGLRDATVRWVLYHEVGHAYDFTYLDDADKRRWADARGFVADPWYPCNGCRDYAFPTGDWAESFAHCETGLHGHFEAELAGPPTAGQCRLLRDLAT